MKKILSIVLAIALGLSLCTMAFAATNAAPQADVTITLDTAGGNTILPITGATGTAMTIPTPVRAGFTFAGWSPTPGVNYPAANATLVAQWTAIVTTTKAATGTILFVLDNAQVYKYMTGPSGTTLSSDPAIPTKAGFTFGAWEPAIAGITYPADGLTTVVTAKWVSNETTAAVVVPTTESMQAWLDLFTEQLVAISKDEKVMDLKAKAKDILAKGSTADIAALADDIVKQVSDKSGIDVATIKDKLSNNEIVRKFMGIYQKAEATTTAAPATEAETTQAPVIPDTGSAVGGIAIFATLSIAAAAAFVCSKKN